MVIMLTQFSWEVVSLRSRDEEKKEENDDESEGVGNGF